MTRKTHTRRKATQRYRPYITLPRKYSFLLWGLIVLTALCCLIGFGLLRALQNKSNSWTQTFETPLAGTLVVDNTIYATDRSGGLWRMRADTGKIEAYLHLGLATTYQPFSIDSKHIGFVSNRGTVLAVDATDFTEAWRIETDQLAEPELPKVDRNFLYFADRNRMVYVVDTTTGKLLWKKSFYSEKEPLSFTEINAIEHTPFYTDDSSLYVGSRFNHQLTQCLLLTGECQIIRNNYDPLIQTLNVNSSVISYTNTNQEYELITKDSQKTLLRQKLSALPLYTELEIVLPADKELLIFTLAAQGLTHVIPVTERITSLTATQQGQFIGTTEHGPQSSGIFLVDHTKTNIMWRTTVASYCNQATSIADLGILSCQEKIYGLDVKTGHIRWQNSLIGTVTQLTSIDSKEQVMIVAQTKTPAQFGMLYGIDSKSGQLIWKSSLVSLVEHSLNATSYGVLALINQGQSLLSLSASLPKSFQWPATQATLNHQAINREKHHSSTNICPASTSPKRTLPMYLTGMKNKIKKMISMQSITVSEIATSPAVVLEIKGNNIDSIQARFWQNQKQQIQSNGFPTRDATYEVRFLPPTTGTWFWELKVKTPTHTKILTGSSKNIEINQQSSVIINDGRWYRNGMPFYGLGWQTCMLDYDFDGIWTDQWPHNSATNLYSQPSNATATEAKMYIQSMKSAGFNLMRLSLENCSPRITQCLSTTNFIIDQQTSAGVDTVLQTAKENQMAVVFGIFGFEPWLLGVHEGVVSPNLAKYLDYVIARYSAYIDVWELANESTPSDEWITAVSEYIQAHDPNHHSITTSWERPDLASIHSTQLHYYDSEPLSEIATRFLPLLMHAKQWQKPAMIGESGNAEVNSDSESVLRFAHKNWLSIFSNVPIIWWDYSTQLYYHQNSANIYVGPVEKKTVQFAHKFIHSYLQSTNIRHFVLSSPNNQPTWLGIETEQHILLYPTEPFSFIPTGAWGLVPSEYALTQLVLPLSGTTIPLQHLNQVPHHTNNSQPFVLVFTR